MGSPEISDKVKQGRTGKRIKSFLHGLLSEAREHF